MKCSFSLACIGGISVSFLFALGCGVDSKGLGNKPDAYDAAWAAHDIGPANGLDGAGSSVDSAIADAEIFSFAWPRPGAVHDLVYARLLPVRQSIGQLLSGYEAAALISGLRTVRITQGERLAAEGRVLLEWTRERLAGCGALQNVVFDRQVVADSSLRLDFEYENGHIFSWHGDIERKNACIEADFGAGRSALHIAVNLLTPDAALSDAMFF